MKLIEKYASRKLRKKAALVKRQAKLPNPESIRKVGVLWQPEQKEGFQFLADHFSASPVILRNLCVLDEKTEGKTGINTITPGELNWLGFPKTGPADEFMATEFDLLLNIALNQNRVLDYLTALSKARFKIGWSPDQSNFFDLNINIGEKQNALFLARQQIFYLSQLNKKV